MNARTRDARPGSPDRFLHCRVVWDDAEEVGVWVANGDKTELVWRERVEVIEAVADRALEQVRDEAHRADLALDAVEVLRDPRMLVPLTIAAVVQVAAIHAGLPVTAARLLGDVAGKLGQRLLAATSGRDRDPAVYYAGFDFDYNADTGRARSEDPEIQKIDRTSRADAIGELLDPRRDGTARADRETRADRGTRADRRTRAGRGTPAAGETSRGTLPDVQAVQPPRASPVAPGVGRRVVPDPSTDCNRLRGVDLQSRSRGGRDSREGRGDLDGR